MSRDDSATDARRQVPPELSAWTPAYIDTIKLLNRRPLSTTTIARLRQLSGAWVEQEDWHFWHCLSVQQPAPNAVAFLRLVAPACVIHRVDIARDRICASPEEAAALHNAVKMCGTVPWHGRQRCREVGDDADDPVSTVYWAERGRRVALCYVRKDSASVLHVELRIKGAGTCRKYGLSNLETLIDADVAGTLDRHFRHSTVANWNRVNAIIEKATGDAVRQRRKIIVHDGNYGSMMYRPAHNRDEYQHFLEIRLNRLARSSRHGIDLLKVLPIQTLVDLFPKTARLLRHQPLLCISEEKVEKCRKTLR